MKRKVVFVTLVLIALVMSNLDVFAMRGLSICPGSWSTCEATYKGVVVFSEKCPDCGSIEITNFE